MSTDRILDAAGIRKAIIGLADAVAQRHPSPEGIAVVGIRTRGVPLAQRLAEQLASNYGSAPAVGLLDINLYRDDLSRIADHPVLRKTEIPFELDDAGVVLVDDVLFTGRTIRAALDSLMDLGRPAWIELAVLVDRGHREVPIQPDYAGLNVETNRGQDVQVQLKETDDVDAVILRELEGGA